MNPSPRLAVSPLHPIIDRRGIHWLVRVSTAHGGVQEYQCESEQQARRFEALLATPVRERPLLRTRR